jgi:hypothetical protein
MWTLGQGQTQQGDWQKKKKLKSRNNYQSMAKRNS